MDENDEARQLIIDYKQTFLSPHGKRVLDHMKACSKYNIAHVPLDSLGRIDVHEVVRNLGLRSSIVNIETMLNTDPDETKGIQNER